jgi:hypothetical protein
VSILWKRAEHYSYLANEFRRLGANESPNESQNYYLQMVVHNSTLAEAARLKTNARTPFKPSTVPA